MDKKLINQLKNGTPQQRRSASYKMAKSKNPTYVPHLIDAYTYDDFGVKRNVVEGLEKIGTEDALEFLKSVEATDTVQYSSDVQTKGSTTKGEITYSPARANNYKSIRVLSSTFQLVAWISAALGGLSLLGAIISAIESDGSYGYSGAIVFFFSFIFGLAFSFMFKFFAESINVIVDIEANSRQSAKTLERLLRSQGQSDELLESLESDEAV